MPLADHEIDDLIKQGLSDEQIMQVAQHVDASQAEAKPSFYSPGEVATRAGVGAVQTLPFGAALMNKAQGKPAYSEGFNGTMQKVGDISNAALTALTAGHGLGAGALINSGLEASGINEGMRKASRAVDESYEPKFQSVAGNMLANAPKLLLSTALELAPAILAGKMRIPEKPAPKIPDDVAARAEFAKREGIPLTKGETMGKADPAAIKEAGFRRVPGGERAALEMQSAQQQAIRESLAKRAGGLGDDVLAGEIRQGGGMSEGRQLADVPEAAKLLRSERGQAVGSAKEALSQEIPIRSNFAKELKGEMQKAIDSLEKAGPGSDRAKARDLLQGYLEHASGVKTMKDAIGFLDDFDSAISDVMSKAKPDVKKVAFGSTRKKIMSVLDEAGEKLAPEQQGNLKTAKAGFAEIADEAQDLKKMEDLNPSALLRKISSGDKSLAHVQAFKKVFPEGTPQRQGLKSSLVQDIIKKGTTKDGLSGAAMEKALGKIEQSTLQEIFSDKPQELADFRGFLKGLSDVEAQRTPLGTAPKGNSHTTPLAEIAKTIANVKVPGSAWVMQKLNDYRSGKAFRPYELKEKKPSPGGNAAKGLQERFGINPLLFSRPASAKAQEQ